MNEKFVNCCGRLECMSYRCGTRSNARKDDADEPAFLVRVNRVVAGARRQTRASADARREREQRVERKLGERRPDLDATHERRPEAPKHAEAGHRHVLAEWIGDQIHLMAERRSAP